MSIKRTLVFFLLLTVIQVRAQIYYMTDKELACAIYSAVLKTVDNELVGAKSLCIQPYTSNEVIKRYSFKDPSAHELGRVNLTDAWRTFLNSIDTADIKQVKVDCDFQNKFKFLKFSSKIPNALIVFSPVLVSQQHDKAICAWEYRFGSDDHTRVVFYLERKNNKWAVVRTVKLSIV